ncbi:hypothetical protein TNCV_152281 [Trichonephila clavipes]|uniref:Tc1-like transposase DDE domain-containing protein n=1 Tax=Trichonephila clavipes TaxID=2585209 RepID=A0A8X6V368_TRICX|nr:hypothetical protein TNCV_152281 [Trichonephila clavipes]
MIEIWVANVESLRSTAAPYILSFKDIILQQDNARLRVIIQILTYPDRDDVRRLPLPTYSTDLSPIENIWVWFTERLIHQHSQSTMNYEVWNIDLK